MNKRIVILTGLFLILLAVYFVGSGFLKNTAVFIEDYAVSSDGRTMTVKTGVSSSIGFVRDAAVRQQDNGRLCLDFYSAFGGLNGRVDAKDTFTFQLNETVTRIAVCRGSDDYVDVLIRDESGDWQRQ